MNPSVSRSILIVTMLCLVAFPICSQEPEVFHLSVMKVIPDRVADAEAAAKMWATLAAEVNHPYPSFASVTDELVYYFAAPVKDWADVEKFYIATQKVWDKGGPAFLKQTMDTIASNRASLWVSRPDLSYTPGPPAGDPMTQTFRHWGFFYGKPGHEPQIEEYLKKFVALSNRTDGKVGWATYAGDFGTDAPVYLWAQFAENEGAFWTAVNEDSKEFGDEADKLWGEMLKHARDVEFFDGQYRPDLSYTPE